MKKMMMLAIMMLAVATLAVQAFPGTNDDELGLQVSSEVRKDQTKTVELRLSNLELKNTRVLIEDFNGGTYFSDTFKNRNGYARALNLNQLPNGRYRLVIRQKGVEMIQIVSVKDNTVLVSQFVSKD